MKPSHHETRAWNHLDLFGTLIVQGICLKTKSVMKTIFGSSNSVPGPLFLVPLIQKSKSSKHGNDFPFEWVQHLYRFDSKCLT